MKKEYTYKIRKRSPDESLGGYGYSLEIYENGVLVSKTGAYASEIMAMEYYRVFTSIK